MVDPEGISKRLDRLATMVEELERIRSEGREVYGYLDVDRAIVWEALERLVDLRHFAAFVRAKMD